MASELIVRPLGPEERVTGFACGGAIRISTGSKWQTGYPKSPGHLLDDDQPMWCRIAEIEGQPAGMMNYILHANTWTDQPACYLEDLFVDADLPGRSTGRLLFETSLDKAKGAGWFRVYWITHKDNATARILYDKLAVATEWVRYYAMME